MLTCIKKTLNSANGNIYETHVHDMRTIYKYILKKHCSKTYAEICWKDVPQTNANSITVCKPLLGSCFFSKCFVATYCLQLKWQEAWVVSRMHRKLPAKYARNFCFRTKNHKIRIWSHNNQIFFTNMIIFDKNKVLFDKKIYHKNWYVFHQTTFSPLRTTCPTKLNF